MIEEDELLGPEDFTAVKRIARYSIHAPRSVILYRWQDAPSHLSVYTDSSWAGCRETRKSTSGAVFMHGAHIIKHYSRTQSSIALSFCVGATLRDSGGGPCSGSGGKEIVKHEAKADGSYQPNGDRRGLRQLGFRARSQSLRFCN